MDRRLPFRVGVILGRFPPVKHAVIPHNANQTMTQGLYVAVTNGVP